MKSFFVIAVYVFSVRSDNKCPYDLRTVYSVPTNLQPNSSQPGALQRMGTAYEERDGGVLYIFGGKSIGWKQQQGLYAFSFLNKSISALPSTSGPALQTVQRRMVFSKIKREIYIFSHPHMWTYSLNTSAWSKSSSSTKLDYQTPSLCYDDDAEKIYLFAGLTPNNGKCNYLEQYDIQSQVWTTLHSTSKPAWNADTYPATRYLHAAVSDTGNGRCYIFGGRGHPSTSIANLNDLWEFEYANQTWKHLSGSSKTGDVPSSALAPGGANTPEMTLDPLQHRLILNYENGYYWEFRIDSEKWNLLKKTTSSPINAGVAVHTIGNTVIFFGGVIRGWKVLRDDTNALYSGNIEEMRLCPECAEGTYLNSSAEQYLCQDCDSGYGYRGSEVTCEPCSPGYGSFGGSTSCSECSKGKSNVDGECRNCTIGKFSDSSGHSSCFTCLPGRSAESPGRTSCDICLVGKFGDAICQNCPEGRFAGFPEAPRCDLCAPGKISSVGSSVCSRCLAGTYGDQRNFPSLCPKCPAGKFSHEPQQTYCDMCPLRTYSPSGGTTCVFCGNSTYTKTVGSTTRYSCACIEGYYGTPYRGGACYLCQQKRGVTCPENSTTPNVAPGYFRSKTRPDIAYECVPPESCSATGLNMSTTCGPGYTGDNCGSCVPMEYFRFGKKCTRCSWWSLLNFLIFFLLIFVFLWLMLHSSTPTYSKIHAFAITAFWLQLLDIVSARSSSWPPTVEWLFVVASSLNFNIDLISPECSFEVSYWMKWHTKMTSTLLLGALQLIFFVAQEALLQFNGSYLYDKAFLRWVAALVTKASFKVEGTTSQPNVIETSDVIVIEASDVEPKLPYRYSRYAFGFSVITSSLYTLIAATSAEIFQCNQQSDGTFFLEKYPSQECFSTYWFQILLTMLLFAGHTLVFSPFSTFSKIKEALVETKDTCGEFYGFYLLPYKKDKFWWHFFTLFHRLVVVFMVEVVSFYFRVVGLWSVVALMLLYIAMLLKIKPHKLYLNTLIDFTWAMFIALCVLLMIFYDAEQKALVVTIPIVILVLFGFAVFINMLSCILQKSLHKNRKIKNEK